MSAAIKLVALDKLGRADLGSLTGAQLLDQVERFIDRFVAYPSQHARVAHTLWIAHAHLMDSFESTPRLALVSAERGSGKTRALEVTEPLVPRPIHAVNVTPAYLFRKVGEEDGRPTILYDEVDTLFGSKVQDTGEIRGLLNAGHRRGAVTGRCVVAGRKVTTEEIPAYCAVALAGIGNLPDTIASRSILIDMRRRAPHESVEPFRHRLHASQGSGIYDSLVSWCALIADEVSVAQPEMPHGVDDRDADCWEPLLAIADAAGGNWPERARLAAKALVSSGAERTQTTGVQLLSDLFDVFEGSDKLPTEIILDRLLRLPESPWAEIGGKPLNDRGLAARLRKYGIRPKVLRLGDSTPRGYLAADLDDPWKRYVLPAREEAQRAQQRNNEAAEMNAATLIAGESREKLAAVSDVADVADLSEIEVQLTSESLEFGERAAILEYEGGLTRSQAEAQAAQEMQDIPAFLDRRGSNAG